MASYVNVLVGTDGSTSSFKAVDRAARLAADAGATLHLVSAYREMSARDRARAADQLGHDMAYKVEGAGPAEGVLGDAEDIAAKAGAKKISKHAIAGDPVDVLIDAVRSTQADVLVVGNRGLNSLAGRLLGSVPQNVSHRAACDVLIVHTT
jgi:nucleotide-binding universal stress UspA family protein